MRISWRQQLLLNPHLCDFDQWPLIALDQVPKKDQKDFLRNKKIVAKVLAGHQLTQVAKEHNLSEGRITQILDRALGSEEDAPPALTAGLIPGRIIVKKQRKQPLPTLTEELGAGCAFSALLRDVPGLLKGLDDVLVPYIAEKNYAQNISPQSFHSEFKRLLKEAHWPTDTYPYTTENTAYESVRRYLHERMKILVKEKDQTKRNQTSRVPRPLKKTFRAKRAVQIDEHKLDLGSRINLVLNDELIPLRIGMISVLVAMDVDTTATLGFWLAQTNAPNQQDLLALIENCITPWTPMTLQTPGFSYEPGACFPSALPDTPISFGMTRMDNAWIHSALSVTHILCNKMGGTVALGLPANPKIRHLIESVFNFINKNFSHRLPSTTGSYPTDPKRESRINRKKPPVITFRTVLEALSIILTSYNIITRAQLGHASPLSLFQHHCTNHYVRYSPSIITNQWQPFINEKIVALCWYRHENRAPFVNFAGTRYSGPGLWDAVENQKLIRIRFDRRRIRTIDAYTLDGVSLGKLYAPASWQRFEHSRATRKLLLKLTRKDRLSRQDPLSDYLHLLLENKDNPKDALSLLRIFTEFTDYQDSALIMDGVLNEQQSISNHSTTTRWNRKMANHRE